MKNLFLAMVMASVVGSCAAMDGFKPARAVLLADGGYTYVGGTPVELLPSPDWVIGDFVLSSTGPFEMLAKAIIDYKFTSEQVGLFKRGASLVLALAKECRTDQSQVFIVENALEDDRGLSDYCYAAEQTIKLLREIQANRLNRSVHESLALIYAHLGRMPVDGITVDELIENSDMLSPAGK